MRDNGLGSWTTRRARMTPHAVALSQDGEDWTYAQVHSRATRLGHALRDRGVGPGDRVAYLGLNSIHFLAVMFATAKLGAIVVPLNTRLAPPETAYILGDADPRILVWDAPFEQIVRSEAVGGLLRERGIEDVTVHDGDGHGEGSSLSALYDRGSEAPLDEAVGLDDVFMIQYTSGTSGRPKGVMLTHGNITFNVYNLLVDLDLTSSEVALVTAPLFHTAALNQLFFPTFLKGGRCLIEAKWDPERALHLIATERVTFLFGVTSMYLSLMHAPGFDDADLSSVQVAMSGGSPLPESLLRAWLDRGQMIVQGYGLTESSPGLTMLRKAEGIRKVGTAGTACFFTDVRVVDPTGRDVPPGVPGEVLGQGPNVTPGYWRNSEATEAAFVEDRWLRTGDLAVVDDEGFVKIVDRVKDMIISGGENVYPAEVEAAIHEHPAIAEAAVIGIPDATWGEVPRAVVSLRPGESLVGEDLLSFLDGRLARYKIPKSVVVLPDLPHNASGKLVKGPLRERFGRPEIPHPDAPKDAP